MGNMTNHFTENDLAGGATPAETSPAPAPETAAATPGQTPATPATPAHVAVRTQGELK